MAKKEKPVIKSISFPSWYQKELNYLESQKNMSEYVCNLIREDMNKASGSHSELSKDQIEQMVQEQVLKHLLALKMASQMPPATTIVEDDVLDDYL